MQPEKNRIAALDNIRGILSLLGIPFHTAFFLYIDSAIISGNLLTQPNQFLLEPVAKTVGHTFLAWFYLYTFWMPVFFLLAGFFAHSTTEKKGIPHFLKNRFFRIGLPLLFYFLWLVPCYLFRILLISAYEKTSYLTTIKLYAHNGNLWSYFNNLMSYWFLEYLLWLYALTFFILIFKKINVGPKKIGSFFQNKLEKLFSNKYIYVVLPTLCAFLLFCSHNWYIFLDENITPSFSLLLFYSVWYFIGWFLWQHKHIFHQLMHYSWLKMLLSFIFYVVFLNLYFHFIHHYTTLEYLISIEIYSAGTILAVFGSLGIAWRYLSDHNAALKYLSKASYWVYFIQIPILWFLSWVVLSIKISFYLQFLIATLICIAICIASYHFFIRRTWLQKILG